MKSETPLDLSCNDPFNNLLSDDVIMSQVKAVEQMLQTESSEQINDGTLTNEELITAAEKFLYLIMCPDPIKQWIAFYRDLFQTQSPDQIILTLNRLMKGPRTQTNKYFHKIVEELFKRILSILPKTKAGKTASNAEDATPQQNLEGNYKLLTSS